MNPEKQSPFRQIYDKGCELWPTLGMGKSASTITAWLNMGCSAEFDIIPLMEQAHAAGKQIHSWSYFTRQATQALEDRKKAEEDMKPKSEEVKVADEAAVMRKYAYLIRSMGRCMPYEERQLQAYEAKHGPIIL